MPTDPTPALHAALCRALAGLPGPAAVFLAARLLEEAEPAVQALAGDSDADEVAAAWLAAVLGALAR